MVAGSEARRAPTGSGGIVGLFARHPTAPNLLMAILILAGLFALTRLNRQFFPDLAIPIITVNVAWPGASAEDVERNILDVLEPELRFIDAVEDVTSYAREGNASMTLEFPSDADMQKAQSDIEQAISQVTTLPEESETPIVSRVTFFEPVGSIAVSGPFSEATLKTYAKQLRDGLLSSGIDKVEFTGARDEEILISINETQLRRHGLTLQNVADKVRDNTQDQPAGILEGATELQLRARSDRKTPEQIGQIEVKTSARGDKVLLRDIATIETAFDRDGLIGVMDGAQAINLSVQRSLSADALTTMALMKDYLAKVRPTLPPTLKLQLYDVRGKLIQQRLSVLLVNGLQGLVLVLITLFIFLNARIAFWTAAGIPIAMLATLAVMLASGQSINMVSMFGLIMMLGIIVDDAIVVGEHAAALEEQGIPREIAAEQAGLRMMAPVTAATLTTAAAFAPIALIGGRIGDILIAIPLAALAALVASLIECFLILPGHLRHGKPSKREPSRWRRGFDNGFDYFRSRIFGPFVDVAYTWRYTTVAVMAALFLAAAGLMVGGRVNFVFFPSLPPENLQATISFSPGVPRDQQIAAIKQITDAMIEAEKSLVSRSKAAAVSDDTLRADDKVILAAFAVIGKAGENRGTNLAEIDVQLTSTEDRTTPVRDIIKAWQDRLPSVPGVESVVIKGRQGGPPGRDIDVRLQNAPVEVLKAASEELKTILRGMPATSAVDDDLPYGKQELVFEVTPRGAALGFTGQSVGRQIRNAFEGAIATRFARGDEEITVKVQREQAKAGLAALEAFYLVTPGGDRVPLREVVSVTERQNFALVIRRDGIRTVSVTANLNTDVMTTEVAVAKLEAEVMPELSKKYGLTYRYAGRAEEASDSFKDLSVGLVLTLAMIYIILAWVFADYWKPLAVMAIVPFGFVGAVFGHYVMGYSLTIISMIGLLGLSGILVNDSIVMVSRLNERIKDGEDLRTAATQAAQDRLRAVLLTSITTIAGLVPLMFETSLQAQFLIPLAVTIVFGVAAATILVLVLVPSLIGIGADISYMLRAILGRDAPPPKTPPLAPAE